MSESQSKPRHVTKGDVFEDLGFFGPEAASLRVKARILSALLACIRKRRYTQAQLVQILDDYQPNVSNLLNGKISKVSIEKLLHYGERLNLHAEITMKPRSTRPGKSRVA